MSRSHPGRRWIANLDAETQAARVSVLNRPPLMPQRHPRHGFLPMAASGILPARPPTIPEKKVLLTFLWVRSVFFALLPLH